MRRTGATLTEVLMAILVMAIGIVSVFTLFPISVLRTIQATQQTNSKILKMNAVELLDGNPQFLTTFEDGTRINGVPTNYYGQWTPLTPFDGTAVRQVVVPTLKPGETRPNPLTFFSMGTTGTTSSVEPPWDATLSVADGAITWQPLPFAGYVVDPLGWNFAISENHSPADIFGNKSDAITGVGVDPVGMPLLRIHGGMSTPAAATQGMSLADHWEETVQGTPVSVTDTSVTFGPNVDISTFVGPLRRVVITSLDGNMTVHRYAGNLAGQTVNLTESIPARFPRNAGVPIVGTVRLEVIARRFTWFLTIRNSETGIPNIKCAVVFNRQFTSAAEHVYDANFSNALAADVDSDGTPDGAQHGIDGYANWVKIAWSDTEPKPLLKPGNWLFDARDVAWYRMQEIFAEGSTGGLNYAVILLHKSVRTQSLPPPSIGRAIIMPGIVEVFNVN